MTLNKLICRVASKPEEGSLCVAEAESPVIPFEVKRVYYSFGVKEGVVRGHHAHKTLEQILICIYGEILVELDNGIGHKDSVILNNPAEGLYVGPSMWHTMKWLKDDSVLLVLASDHYNETDYIRDYDDFLSWYGGGADYKYTQPNASHFYTPFNIKRLYYIYGVHNGVIRGYHAHKKLEQILICTYGKIEVTLDNGDGIANTVVLSDPFDGLYVGPSTWRTMKWLKSNSVLLVLASEHYDESDYIRDYDEFISWIKVKKED